MVDKIPYIRVFISSPSDVNTERKITLDVIDCFPNRPAYREKVAFRVVAWDKPGAGTAMLGSLTPQEAINRGLPKPSECDIVIVIFWSRMGTPFTDIDNKEYLSGTHWELLDALNSHSTETMIFRRTEEKLVKISDKLAQEQNERVKNFFKSDLFYRKDGSIVRGVNQYQTPDDFRRDFEIFFEELVARFLKRYLKGEYELSTPVKTIPSAHADNIKTFQSSIWEGSPFPGLRAFTELDAPIFFGRGREIDKLVKQLENARFVAVVGASGSGKSSLVGAGLIPRLMANAIDGSAEWLYARFTPGTGSNPFEALVKTITDIVPSLTISGDAFARRKAMKERTKMLIDDPSEFIPIIEDALQNSPEHVNLLLFIDQFEELFALANTEYIRPFASMLAEAVNCVRLRIIVTIRHDFSANVVEIADLADLMQDGFFALSAPRRDALRQMIERPAERAGLQLESGLVERILDDTGDKPGNLALMAYVLDELYKLSGDGYITHTDYNKLGGVQGAIGNRAEQVYAMLSGDEIDKDKWMQRVFHELVAVDERGTATRRRIPVGRIAEDDHERVDFFVNARLLTYDASDGVTILEVAHEALFRSWERLKNWITEAQEDLILLRQVRTAAEEWHERDRPDYLLWHQERLTLVYNMIEFLHPELNEVERDFIEPEQSRLLDSLASLDKKPQFERDRLDIGNRLAVIGDKRVGVGVTTDGIPEIMWLPVNVSNEKIKLKVESFEGDFIMSPRRIHPFAMSMYQVTYLQFQSFLTHVSGFDQDIWWEGFPKAFRKQEVKVQRSKNSNNPRDRVSWYQSVAFARWLNDCLRGTEITHSDLTLRIGENAEVRLPTEWEWQWAAQSGPKSKLYPWGGNWQSGYANTSESGLGRAIAVGMYSHNAPECGTLDMAGNLYEWCQSDVDEVSDDRSITNDSPKILRGGSFEDPRFSATCSFRYYNSPGHASDHYGLRLVVGVPLSDLKD